MIIFFRKLWQSYLEGVQWGYNKRYVYQLNSLEEKKNTIYAKFHVRGKRVLLTVKLNDLITQELDTINELHPIDACIIGITSISTQLKVIQFLEALYKRYKKNRFSLSTIKAPPIFTLSKQVCLQPHNFSLHGNKVSYFLTYSTQKYEINLEELLLNPFLLCGVSAKTSFKIGQEIAYLLLDNKL